MPSTVAQFREYYPEFANTTNFSDLRIMNAQNKAIRRCSDEFGDSRDEAIDLLTAHFLALSEQSKASASQSQSGGFVTGQSTGSISRVLIENEFDITYASDSSPTATNDKMSLADRAMASTIYGIQYEDLKRSVLIVPGGTHLYLI